VLCALFPRLCAHATTVGEALQVLAPRRRSRRPPSARADPRLGRDARLRDPAASPELAFGELPTDPGVYIFRDAHGEVLYVGKSVSIRSRARAHFAPSSPPAAWTRHARVVDYRTTTSELGALVLENRLIKEHRPPGNKRLVRGDDRLVYVRCRLDIPFPILEVAPTPAAGHGVTIGPVHGRRLALELVEQLDSLFGLRHCGRTLPRREHPSAYGQMGRCLSPCLGDLDPNLYRRRLDAVLGLFSTGDGAEALLAHVWGQMREAARRRQFERAGALQRRHARLRTILRRLGGMLEATHARPRLVVVGHPTDPDRAEGFWLAGGRLIDYGALPADPAELRARGERARRLAGRVGELGAHVPPDEVDEVRLIGAWLASHPETEQRPLRPGDRPVPVASSGRERQLDDNGLDLVLADVDT
jgi:DNA polymerase-3 subunit epsilon